MQQEQQNLPKEAEVVNKLAELRKQHNDFRRNEQQEEENAPMGSSLVEREEIPQVEEVQNRQNEEIQNHQIEEVRAMIPQQFDQMIGDEEDNGAAIIVIITDVQVKQFKALSENLGLDMTEDMMVGKSAEDVSNAIIGAALESGKTQEEIEAAMGAPVKVPEVIQAIEQIPKESIKVSQEELDEMDQKYPNGLSYNPAPYAKPQHDEQHLDIANLVQADKTIKEKANFFVCSICTMVVKGPLECSGCQTLFCSDCIDPWRQNNSHCPKKCQGNEDVEFRTVHRYVQHDLQDLKFKCANSGCDSVNKYSQAIQHVQKCHKLVQACVQGCDLGIVGEDMTYHCVKQCHFYKKSCDQCGEFSTFPNKLECSAQIADHDCLQVVMQKLKEERETVATLKEQNELLKNGHGLDDEEEEKCQLTGLKCAEAHDLEVHEGDVDSYDGNPRCDLCQTEDLNEHPRFYRCRPCGYDCCEACANILCDDSEDE